MSKLFWISPYRIRRCKPCDLPEDLRSFVSLSGKFQPALRSESLAVGAEKEVNRGLVSPKPPRIWESEPIPSAAAEQGRGPCPQADPARSRAAQGAVGNTGVATCHAGSPAASRVPGGGLRDASHWGVHVSSGISEPVSKIDIKTPKTQRVGSLYSPNLCRFLRAGQVVTGVTTTNCFYNVL